MVYFHKKYSRAFPFIWAFFYLVIVRSSYQLCKTAHPAWQRRYWKTGIHSWHAKKRFYTAYFWSKIPRKHHITKPRRTRFRVCTKKKWACYWLPPKRDTKPQLENIKTRKAWIWKVCWKKNRLLFCYCFCRLECIIYLWCHIF